MFRQDLDPAEQYRRRVLEPAPVPWVVMYNAVTRSQVFVLDQDEALEFYTSTLGLELADVTDLGFMRWLKVRVPGDPDRRARAEAARHRLWNPGSVVERHSHRGAVRRP